MEYFYSVCPTSLSFFNCEVAFLNGNPDAVEELRNYLEAETPETKKIGRWEIKYLSGAAGGNEDYVSNILYLVEPNIIIDPTVLRIYFSFQCAIIKTEHPEYPEWRVKWKASQEMLHLVLDGIGFVPGYGEVADLTNGAIYAIQGDGVNATLSATSAIPFVGWFTMGAKYAKKTINLANGSKTTLKWVRKAGNFVNFGSSGQLRTILGLVPGDKLRQAHHIIPWGKQTHEVVQRAAKANGANPFHMNSALNGVAVATWKNQPNHYAYDNRVVERLNEILSSNPTPQQANEQIGDLIDNIRNAIINNPNSHLNDLIF
ncbi:AHH domain-containing protein [Pedobacter terrae]|uniref:AHH domain-containing protein n=1 Tax=Pedobacter terrae TaxID=405671 RepID=UPI002FF75670